MVRTHSKLAHHIKNLIEYQLHHTSYRKYNHHLFSTYGHKKSVVPYSLILFPEALVNPLNKNPMPFKTLVTGRKRLPLVPNLPIKTPGRKLAVEQRKSCKQPNPMDQPNNNSSNAVSIKSLITIHLKKPAHC